MFLSNTGETKHTLVFVAGFHLGVPLTLRQPGKAKGWMEISKELSESFACYPNFGGVF